MISENGLVSANSEGESCHCGKLHLPFATAEAWLRTHPEVDIVSRDRGGEYAAAAKKGAPQAQQIADRFHLLKNLRERLKEVMDRRQSCLPEVEEHASDAIPAKPTECATSYPFG